MSNASKQSAGAIFQRLVDIMAALRAEQGGCPWDLKQTLGSLRPYLLEETYEVLDAIDRGDLDALEGEIGDLLFEGVFLAQIADDEGHFNVAQSLEHIVDKLIRRHPHVFGKDAGVGTDARKGSDPLLTKKEMGSDPITTPEQVHQQWEQIKAQEQESRGEQKSVLGGVKRSLPALLRAYEIGTRVAAVGFDWAKTDDVMEKVREEVDELGRALRHESAKRAEEEMGDLLFALANLARKMGIEPESALRQANEKFTSRFEQVERRLESRGRSVHDATLDEMEAEWQTIKQS